MYVVERLWFGMYRIKTEEERAKLLDRFSCVFVDHDQRFTHREESLTSSTERIKCIALPSEKRKEIEFGKT